MGVGLPARRVRGGGWRQHSNTECVEKWGGGGAAPQAAYTHTRIIMLIHTIIWGNTGRVINFKVVLKIVRKGFLEFFFHKKIHKLL
jgi:hypothetical protein